MWSHTALHTAHGHRRNNTTTTNLITHTHTLRASKWRQLSNLRLVMPWPNFKQYALWWYSTTATQTAQTVCCPKPYSDGCSHLSTPAPRCNRGIAFIWTADVFFLPHMREEQGEFQTALASEHDRQRQMEAAQLAASSFQAGFSLRDSGVECDFCMCW